MSVPAVDVTSSDFKANAYTYYARLRAEAPVHPVKLPSGPMVWLVSRYDDVAPLLKDTRLAKDRRNARGSRPFSRLPAMFRFLQAIEHNMLDLDPPDHTRLRGLVHLAFTPRLVERMRARIESLSEELLSRALAAGSMDLIAAYALPIPLTVISEMLGIPAADQHRFHKWSSAIVASTAGPNLFGVLPAIWKFIRYIRPTIAAKRAQPQDDLISALVQAEEAGERLREEELVAMVFLLVVAGHETTVNLIGNGALALLQFPEQLARLRGAIPRSTPPRWKSCYASTARSKSRPSATRARRSRSPASPSRKAPSCTVSCRRRTATRRSSKGPTFLTWGARGTATWPSDKASTTAWARRWPDSKDRSPSGGSSIACQLFILLSPNPACAGAKASTCGDSKRCR